MDRPANLSVLEAIARRRSVRAYTDAVVTRDQVEALLDAAVRAPTAMHLEPWSFLVVQDRAVLARLSERAKALIAHRDDHHGLAPGLRSPLLDPSFNIFYDAGTLIVICARPLGAFATADCWLAAENVMLAACALGLATCPIGFAVPALHDAEVKSWLGIPPEVTAVAPILVGVPRVDAPPQPRRPPQVLRWILS